MAKKMEHKQFDAIITDIDEEQGIVKAIFAVMGNIDEGNDRIHPGSFTKTFSERGQKVLVLDNHRSDSTGDVIAKPLAFREVSRDELPPELIERVPDATGGAEMVAQFEPDPDKDKTSAGAFYRIKNEWVSEWSFGYDALDTDYSAEEKDGREITVRNLRTIKLYEVSPVLWGMNDATMTTDAKGQPSDEDAGKASPLILSTKNLDRVEELLTELRNILAGDFKITVEDDKESSDEEAPPPEAAAEAGSDEEPPTNDDDTLLQLIELEIEETEVFNNVL